MACGGLTKSILKVGKSANPSLTYPNKTTIPGYIRHWRDTKPDEEAFVFVTTGTQNNRTVVKWRELYERSVQHAKALMAVGVKEKDVVAMNLPGCPESLYLHFGIMFAGAIPYNVVFSYKDGSDVISNLNTVKCSTFVLDPKCQDLAWPIFKTFLKTMESNGDVVSDIIPSLKCLIFMSRPDQDPNAFSIDEMLQMSLKDVHLPVIDPSSIALLFPTSGSTGRPKIIAHTHSTLPNSLCFLNSNGTRKVFHRMNFMWSGYWPRNVLSGDTWVCAADASLTSEDLAKFTIRIIQQERCTSIDLNPRELMKIINLVESGQYTLTVTDVFTGGQPLGQDMGRCLGTLCSTLIILYGSTECSVVSINRCTKFEEFCCGTPLPGVEVKIVGENDEVVPFNRRGELLVKSPYMFVGYYNNPDLTSAAFTDDGWFRTSDIGRMSENGTLFVEGRKSDMISTNTVNVLPSELESILRLCPGVEEVVIVPLKHETLYQQICACIVVKADTLLKPNQVKAFYEDFKISKNLDFHPDFYLFFDSFPKTQSGKVSKLQVAKSATEQIKKRNSESGCN